MEEGKGLQGQQSFKKVTPITVSAVLFFSVCLSCVNSRVAESPPELKGELRIGGSTTVSPIVEAAAKSFQLENPKVQIITAKSSSGTGISELLSGKVDIANASRDPKPTEIQKGLEKGVALYLTAVASDAIAVIVHPDNPLDDISLEELNTIFFGDSKSDWRAVGDGKKKGPIQVYRRDSKLSGTASLFEKRVIQRGKARYVQGSRLLLHTPQMVPTVAKGKDSIGYSPLKWIDESVKVLKVNGVGPTPSAILNGLYPFSRRLYMITDGAPTGLSREFISDILGVTGQHTIVKVQGFIPIL